MAKGVPMLCGYCLARLTWPDDFPVRTEACCRPCGVRLYGWPEEA